MDAGDTAVTRPPPPSTPVAQAGQRGPIAGFCFDMLIAVATLLVVGVGCVVVWAFVKGIGIGLQGGGEAGQAAAQLGQPGPLAQIGMNLIATSAAALLVYFWRRRATAVERAASWRAARRPATWALATLAGLATFAFSIGVGWLGGHAGIEPVPTNQLLIEAVIGSHPWFLLLFAVVLAPAYEELLFRRVLFGRLWAAGRPWLGIVLSSVAFALMHEVPGLSGNDPPAVGMLWLSYTSMGAVFAWVYWRTGTLWAAIGAHAINNLAACATLIFG